MPFSPSPVLPGRSPRPPPGPLPASGVARRLAALIALPVLVVALVVGQIVLPQLLFLVPGLQAQASVNTGGGASGLAFQGFVYPWMRREHDANSGYTASVSLQNMQSQSSTFHMNAVIIPVVANMPERSERYIAWHNTDKFDVDTLPESDYVRAITDARKAGLLPILELQMSQQDNLISLGNESGTLVGTAWSGEPSTAYIQNEEQGSNSIATLERQWFDNYTMFAVHFAQLSQQYHLPYYIIGDELINVSYDTSSTNAKNDPKGIDRGVPGDTCPANAAGRRDCEWRHVVNAIRSPTYNQIANHKKSLPGGAYSGKLIYAASWTGASVGNATDSEFDHITWWDAVDYIGVDAGFPLMANQRDAGLDALVSAWHGTGTNLAALHNDIYGRIAKVASTYGRPVIFTSAGYNSVGGANSLAFQSSNFISAVEDDAEQYNDMRALLLTFSAAPWWQGVFWNNDQPIPRDKQANWTTSTAWAGPTLATSKEAGQWLAKYYRAAPIHCSC
ncbi:MAG: glycoside hydrolase family 113 [Ktedonobacterales bacterium]